MRCACRPTRTTADATILLPQTNPNYGFLLTPRERLNAILDQGIQVFYALQVRQSSAP